MLGFLFRFLLQLILFTALIAFLFPYQYNVRVNDNEVSVIIQKPTTISLNDVKASIDNNTYHELFQMQQNIKNISNISIINNQNQHFNDFKESFYQEITENNNDLNQCQSSELDNLYFGEDEEKNTVNLNIAQHYLEQQIVELETMIESYTPLSTSGKKERENLVKELNEQRRILKKLKGENIDESGEEQVEQINVSENTESNSGQQVPVERLTFIEKLSKLFSFN